MITSSLANNVLNQSLIGQWKITKFLTALPVGELSEQQTISLMGKKLTVTASSVSLGTSLLQSNERSCSIHQQDGVLVKQNPMTYFQGQGYFLDSEDITQLGLTTPFLAFDSICISIFSRKNPDEIVLLFGENFFEAKKILAN